MSNKIIKNLQFSFENCEIVTIPERLVTNYCFDGVSHQLRGTRCNGKHMDTLSEGEFTICEQAIIDIKLKELKKIINDSEMSFKKESIYDRITEIQDLVSVTINYTDNTNVEIYPHWHPASDDINYNETFIVKPEENLLRVIIKNNDKVMPENIKNEDE